MEPKGDAAETAVVLALNKPEVEEGLEPNKGDGAEVDEAPNRLTEGEVPEAPNKDGAA